MEKYKNAKVLFSESKFEQSLADFKKSFSVEALSENEKIDCLSQIIKIQKILNHQSDSYEIEKELAEFLIEKKDFARASKTLEELSKNKASFSLCFRLIETYLMDGNLIKAEGAAEELFRYLYIRKNFSKSKKLYQFTKEQFPKNLKIEAFMTMALIQEGNIEELEKAKYIKNADILFETFVTAPFIHWRHSFLYVEVMLSGGLVTINYELNKIALKLFLDRVLLGSKIGESSLNAAFAYFNCRERKTISRLICNYADTNSLKLNQKIVNQIASLAEDAELDTDFDLGDDLFFDVEKREGRPEKIVKDILMLESLNEFDEAQRLKHKLRKVSPDHHLLKSEYSGSRLAVKKINAFELEEKWSEMFLDGETTEQEICNNSKATVANLDDETLLSNYSDLVVCFNTMDLYTTSQKVLLRVEGILGAEKLQSDLEFNYLKIKTLIGENDIFKAYDIVTQLNGSCPMTKETRVEFLYLQGEIARRLGRVKDAVKSYLLVKEINPHYRLVGQRLRSFG